MVRKGQGFYLWNVFADSVHAALMGSVVARTKIHAHQIAQQLYPGRLHIEIDQQTYQDMVS